MSENTVPKLARLAGCADPDGPDSPGARFLRGIEDTVAERIEDGSWDDDDTTSEIADGAVPVYTHEKWQTFIDLAAYEEDMTEFGPIEDFDKASDLALYQIGERLARALHDEGNNS